MVGRRWVAALAVAGAVAAAPVLAAASGAIPVRVRILKGSKQGPASVDPKLADLAQQLGGLAYVRWEQVNEKAADMEVGKTLIVALPDGTTIELTIADARKDTVTFDVKVPARKTHSRLTIPKDKRIVHQVAEEKAGEAYFATVRPWP